MVKAETAVVSVVKVTLEGTMGDIPNEPYFAVSFFEFENGKIVKLDEYWGSYIQPEEWRKDTHGKSFR